MEGFGTDAYLALNRDDTRPENYPELLPETELTIDGLAAASSAPVRPKGQVDRLGYSAGAGVLAS